MNPFGPEFGELIQKLRKSKVFYGVVFFFIILALFGFLPEVPLDPNI